jgi:transposase
LAKTLHWLHVLATDTLTWMGCHPKRGGEAFDALALLGQFTGVLVHDGCLPYKALECQHALCNAHHLRELTYLLEEQDHAWAGDMIELLTHANHLDNLNCTDGKTPNYNSRKYQAEIRELRDLYEAILAQAQTENPLTPSTGKRGRPKQSKATNLIGRLRDYRDDFWRFMTHQMCRLPTTWLSKPCACPRSSKKSPAAFVRCQERRPIASSCCATMHKQGANVYESLVAAFKGAAPQPCFG